MTISCERTYVGFKPADELSNVVNFRTGENFKVSCTAAELKLANIKLALGVTTAITASYVPTGLGSSLSFTVNPANDKWDSLKLGDSKTIHDFVLKLEHTRYNNKKVVVVFYKVQCLSNIDYAFKESDISMQTLEFQPLLDTTRTEGDRIGVMYEQVA